MLSKLIYSCLVISGVFPLLSVGVDFVYGTVQSPLSNSSTSFPIQADIRAAPKYCANTLEGKLSCLEDYHERPILVNVWATWCIPCREEMPALEALYKEFSSKGFDIIGVSIDSPGSEKRIKTFANRMGITYTIWHDPDDKFTRAFRTIGVPESFLINRDGQIVYSWKGPFDAMSEDTKTKVTYVVDNNILNNMNNNTNKGNTPVKVGIADNSNASILTPTQPQQQQQQQSSSNYQTIGYPVAFVAGILSFLSPCILPLIPSYVAFITGMSMEQLTTNKRKGIDGAKDEDKHREDSGIKSMSSNRLDIGSSKPQEDTQDTDRKSFVDNPLVSQLHVKHTAIVRGLLFIGGFSVVFISLGASITAIGAAFSDYSIWIERIGGALVIIFGLHLLGILRIPGSEREWGFHFSKRPIAGHIGSFIIGMGFGAGWTPCIGPILASILTIAASSTSLMTGVNLLAVYSAGLAIPFILSTIAVEKFMIVFKRFRKWLPWFNRASAALLIGVGVILITGTLTLITGTLSGFGIP